MAADVQYGWPAKMAGLGQLPFQQKLGLLLTIAAMIALVAGAWMWGKDPDFRVLYSNLSDRDGGAIIEALEKSGTPYKFTDGGGAIMVPAEHVYDARLRLAAQGIPKGGIIGFELMENQKLGTSQFQEQVNYQRALEGELARSIQSLSAVRGARVHLAITKPSVFVREQSKPSASVLLDLFPGKGLDPAQVSAITHLVSSSVPELAAKNVTVVDQTGSLLSTPTDGSAIAGLDSTQLKYIDEVEQSYVRRVESIVTPIVGAGNVRAQVTADIDFSQIEHTAELYKPNQNPADSAVRSQHVTETLANGAQSTGGIPGALTNQPPSEATAPIVASAADAAAASAKGEAGVTKQNNLNKESTVNYEVDKTIKYTIRRQRKTPFGCGRRQST
jgi:flagellar M-ring protein FliF